MGSWAQLKCSSPPTAQEMAEEMKKAESEGEKCQEKEKKKTKGDGSSTAKKSDKREKTQTI